MGQGDGSFVETTIPITPLAPPNNGNGIVGLGAFFDDVDGDGARDFFALDDDGEAWFSWGHRATGGFSRDNSLSDVLSQTDPMSLSPLDYNGDGVMDYFVSGVQTQSRLLTGGSRSVSNVGFAASVEGTDDTFAWGSWAFDADLDGSTDVFLQRTGRSSSGPDADNNFPGPTEIYLNHGDGTFYNASDALLGSVLTSMAIACGDLSGMAHRACLAQSSTGPVLFTDDIVPRGPWVGLRLRGTVSAPDATGARVAFTSGSPATSYYYGQGAGYGAHDPSLVLGVGSRPSTDVAIHWPSGIAQTVPARPMGAYTTVTEPQVVALSARVAPADGRSTVTVTVNPALIQASQATVALSGVGTLSPQPAAVGAPQWTVTAPTTPGDAVLTVTLDGHELVVRPRVHFRAS
jgi:hypothetical protein